MHRGIDLPHKKRESAHNMHAKKIARTASKYEIDSRSLFVNDLVVFGFPALKFQGAVLPAKFL